MKKYFLLTLTIIAAMSIMAGAAFYSKSRMTKIQIAKDKAATVKGVKAVVNANNQFALDLYAELGQGEDNIFFSPYSIASAMAMTYEGARGKTAEDIQSVFPFPVDDKLRRSAFAAIHDQLNKQDSKYELNTANSLWVQKDHKLLDSYLTTVKRFYGGDATNLDFIGSTEESRETINRWVESKTNNMIKDLLPSDSLNSLTRLVLTNAIYFKGAWLKPFDKGHTGLKEFRASPSTKILVPTMKHEGEKSKFNYAQTDDLQILEMPYKGDDLSMLIFLPKDDDLSSLEGSLTLDKIDDWKNKLTKQQVDVFLPKFSFDAKYYLKEILKKMGMPAPFSPAADLSGIDGAKGLFLGQVIHQSFIDVNEEGTEAAAATAFGVLGGLDEETKLVFRADHPFLFIIHDKTNGNILFIGKVRNPEQ